MILAFRRKTLGRAVMSAAAGAVAAAASIPWAFLVLFPVLWFACQPLRLPTGEDTASGDAKVGPLLSTVGVIAVTAGAALGWIAGVAALR